MKKWLRSRFLAKNKYVNEWINKTFQDQTSFLHGCKNYNVANKMRMSYTYYNIAQIMNYTTGENKKLQWNQTYMEINKTYK